jgi:H/ACA ribonucleoprotein complex non-core subunit NAF1
MTSFLFARDELVALCVKNIIVVFLVAMDTEAPTAPFLAPSNEGKIDDPALMETEFDSDPLSSSSSDSEEEGEDVQMTKASYLSNKSLIASLMDSAAAHDNGKDEVLMTKNEKLPPPPRDIATIVIPTDAVLNSLGLVTSVLSGTIIIQGNPQPSNAPLRLIDAGTPVCLHDRSPVGVVDDTFGPVSHPFFSVRVHPELEAKVAELYAGQEPLFLHVPAEGTIFTVPDARPGCDASDMNDEEVPEELRDCSDDEFEQRKKRERKAKNKNKRTAQSSQVSSSSASSRVSSSQVSSSSSQQRNNGHYTGQHMQQPQRQAPLPYQQYQQQPYQQQYIPYQQAQPHGNYNMNWQNRPPPPVSHNPQQQQPSFPPPPTPEMEAKFQLFLQQQQGRQS